MKFVAVLVAAAFVMAAGTSLAVAECPGHNKAQMVKTKPQEQVSQEQSTQKPFTVAEKAAVPAKTAEQTTTTAEKK